MPGVASGPTLTPLLEVGCEPDQLSAPAPPLAAQDVALVLIQLSEAVEPGVIVSDEWPLALRATVGCCGAAAFTVTVVVAGELAPPAPVHVKVYVTVPALGNGPTAVPVLDGATVPLNASEPLPPPAVHDVALLVLQARDVLCPTVTVAGLAANEPTLAAGVALLTVTSTEAGELAPPGPVQLSV
jgi:hypothetical protein